MSLLLPELSLSFSAQLAQTLGLEEAILLQVLHQSASLQANTPYQLDVNKLCQAVCFWSAQDVQRVLKSLSDKGILQQHCPPITQCTTLLFSLASVSQNTPVLATRQATVSSQGANRISPYWQPDETVLQQLAQHQISADFARQQVNEFVTYWRDRGEISHSWSARFYQHVVRSWQQKQNQPWLQNKEAKPLENFWKPSPDALSILQRNGINPRFIEDAIPEFVLYWQEKGAITNTWNTKFIQHVKRQWARYTSSLKYDSEPRRIPVNWQPSNDVYDILRMANIDIDFAKERIQEFVLYWKDSNQLHASWNTKFLQHVKYCWANQWQQGANYATQQLSGGQGKPASSFIDKHSDRSWAD